MKIIFIISSLKAHGGTERIVTLLANELCAKQNIEIINRDTDKTGSSFPIVDKVQVTTIKGNLCSFYFKLKKYLQQSPCDLVVVHNMGKLSLFISLLPSKIEMWTYEHVAKSSRPVWLNFLGRMLYERYSKIITITKKDALSYNNYKSSVITLVNPCSYDVYKYYDNCSKTIIAVGRLTYQKGFDKLIKAWGILDKQYSDWSLCIYGDGEDYQLLNDMIKKENIHNVIIHSATSDIDLLYQKSAFLVMSSRYEGLGMVLVEAQTFSLPIISFDCPHGPSEIITHEKDGLLVENQNVEKLAEAIESLIIDPDKRKMFSQNASVAAERFSKEKIIATWQKMLSDIDNK